MKGIQNGGIFPRSFSQTLKIIFLILIFYLKGNFNDLKLKLKKDFHTGLLVIIFLVGYYYMPDENSSSLKEGNYTICDCYNYV